MTGFTNKGVRFNTQCTPMHHIRFHNGKMELRYCPNTSGPALATCNCQNLACKLVKAANDLPFCPGILQISAVSVVSSACC